jgi:hypothetical protein
MGALAATWHFPLPELLPVKRPEASRWVPLKDPVVLPWVAWLPVSSPDESPLQIPHCKFPGKVTKLLHCNFPGKMTTASSPPLQFPTASSREK